MKQGLLPHVPCASAGACSCLTIRLRQNRFVWPVTTTERFGFGAFYAFEYSDTGDNRRHGSVTLLGSRVIMLDVTERVLELVK